MNYTVWKFHVPWGDEVTVDMPEGAQIIDAQPQGAFTDISLWAIVDTEAPRETRRFRVAGTGHPIDNPYLLDHISTMQFQDSTLVFHLFEIMAMTKDQQYVNDLVQHMEEMAGGKR